MILPRLETLHPALAHLALGGLPLLVIAYALAHRRRSASWTFVGDVALLFATAAALATFAFGLVSDQTVAWPGGLERWRLIHLVGGAVTTTLLAILAGLRFIARRHDAPVALGAVLWALAAAGAAGLTGYVGGDVLVFHGGMAVRAAGGGALSPTIGDASPAPKDFLDAMRSARASWGDVTARLAAMLVQHPSDEDFAHVERSARSLEASAAFMGAHAGPREHDAVISMSQALGADASDLAEAAHKHDLEALARALGETNSDCASCHAQARW